MKQTNLRKLVLLSLALIVLTVRMTAQTVSFSRLVTDSAYLQNMKKQLEEQYQKDAETASGPYKKYIKDIYKERYEYIRSCFEQGAIISDPKAVQYLQSVTQTIVQGNPELTKHKLRILLYKAWWPNASSLGEGTILCNIGLLYKVRNEAQLAFILCHELAHLHLNHGNQAIDKYVNTVYDDEFQKELKKIAKQQYEKNRKLNELEKSIEFSSRRHSRAKESEADSMAIEFLKNTPYSLEEAKTALAQLDSIDDDKYNIEPPLQQYFNHPSYPFKKAWLKEEESFFGGATMEITDSKLLDSLKTHPDCRKRVIQVSPIVSRYAGKGTQKNLFEKELRQWQEAYDFEVIAFLFDKEIISLALYQTLQALDHYRDDPWLLAMAGQCLNRIYEAQKKHELSRIVELPSPYHEKKYNDFLRFLQNLTLTDIASINYYFLDSHKDKSLTNEDFVFALIQSRENAGKKEERSQWIQYYQSNFSKPRYTIKP